MIFLYAWATVAHVHSIRNPNSDSLVPINPLDDDDDDEAVDDDAVAAEWAAMTEDDGEGDDDDALRHPGADPRAVVANVHG